MVDALGLEGFAHHVGSVGEPGTDVAASVGRGRQDVSVERPDRIVGPFGDRLVGVGDRGMHLVGHVDQRRSLASDRPGLGHHMGKYVAEIAGSPADRNEDRPVLVDESTAQLAGHVCAGEHSHHALNSLSRGGVDSDDVGSGVFAQMHRTVQQPVGHEVVDKGSFAEREGGRFVLHAACTDGRPGDHDRHFASGDVLDGVEDLDVASATAQVSAEQSRGVLAGEIRALLVDHGLGAHHDAGSAKAALQGAVRSEVRNHLFALLLAQTFEREHLGACGLLKRRLAGNPGLAIDHHRAAATLSGRSATVLGREHAKFIAKRRQQMLVMIGHGHPFAVQCELSHPVCYATPRKPALLCTRGSRAYGGQESQILVGAHAGLAWSLCLTGWIRTRPGCV